MAASAPHSRNLLLGSLSREDFACLDNSLERVPLHADAVMLKPGAAIERIYFPEGGVVSFHEIMQDGSRVGVAIIGFEGFTGWPALFGIDESPHEATVAIGGGTALSITPADLLRICQERQAIRALLLALCPLLHQPDGPDDHVQPQRRIGSAPRPLAPHEPRPARGDQINLTHQQLG
jgi:CRP-like cAMP-binding protein